MGGKVSHYKSTLPWLGPLRELDFGLFIAAISLGKNPNIATNHQPLRLQPQTPNIMQ